ncbi:MAG: threonine--tRNA ligase [Firmicutes bacterium]|nr:threonine--tRNA ligase [Bacillota bacterium]MDD4707096.1 threonine--tRNA ligase [Bacillota bacterium]
MEKIRVFLKDGSEKEYRKGITVAEVAEDISKNLARAAVIADVDGALVELGFSLEHDCKLNILTFRDEDGKDAFRHTSSHIMAQAVKRLFPEAKLAIGPAIQDGFYYDFDVERPFSTEDLAAIEEEMNKIVKEDHPLKRHEMERDVAIDFFKARGEEYKVELIEDLEGDVPISLYSQGEFTDLCAGPHAPSTGKVKAFKLLSVAGAYWRGSEKNKMLQRIYGTSFEKKKDLADYLKMLEEAKRRDHRKIGRELDLFSIMEEGPGFPFFHPKGMVIRNLLEDFWRKEHVSHGYQEVKTPIILSEGLWHRSGHWDHYKENMYFTEIDEGGYAVKPMNCPGGMLLYGRRLHSYRELPQRVAELGLVHRHELSGALHGLMRVRCFTQDDAHIYMLPSQIKEEIIGVIELTDYLYSIFGFEYRVELSTKPENSMGSDEDWEVATNALREALEAKGIDYKINEGDGAFYGPKIDFHLKDCIGRTWQCGTIQLDFQMPERFDLVYIGADGEKHRPVMIHRTIFGSIERFIAILTEHYAGAFPLWLAPVQVKVLPITDKHNEYAEQIRKDLFKKGFRAEADLRNEKVGYKIREAQVDKIPFMLIVGDKEMQEGTVSVRERDKGDLGASSLNEFVEEITEIVDSKK